MRINQVQNIPFNLQRLLANDVNTCRYNQTLVKTGHEKWSRSMLPQLL